MIYYLIFIGSICLSVLCDLLMQILSTNISIYVIIFLRFSIASSILFVLYKSQKENTPLSLSKYICRGVLLTLAMLLWIVGLGRSTLANASALNLLLPLFIIVFAAFCLKQKLTSKQIFLSSMCFMISTIYLFIKHSNALYHFVGYDLCLIASVILFALVEILNKKAAQSTYIKDSLGISVILSICCLPLFIANIQGITPQEIILVVLLGIISALMYIMLFSAYKHCNITIMASLRYLELPIAIAIDYLLSLYIVGWYEILFFMFMAYTHFKILSSKHILL